MWKRKGRKCQVEVGQWKREEHEELGQKIKEKKAERLEVTRQSRKCGCKAGRQTQRNYDTETAVRQISATYHHCHVRLGHASQVLSMVCMAVEDEFLLYIFTFCCR